MWKSTNTLIVKQIFKIPAITRLQTYCSSVEGLRSLKAQSHASAMLWICLEIKLSNVTGTFQSFLEWSARWNRKMSQKNAFKNPCCGTISAKTRRAILKCVRTIYSQGLVYPVDLVVFMNDEIVSA